MKIQPFKNCPRPKERNSKKNKKKPPKRKRLINQTPLLRKRLKPQPMLNLNKKANKKKSNRKRLKQSQQLKITKKTKIKKAVSQ